ncbi:MAG: 3'-5' exonuclease, partial [Vulcanimicrobiaceae bacterium]
ALLARARRLAAGLSPDQYAFVAAPAGAAVRRLRDAFAAGESAPCVHFGDLGELAFATLRSAGVGPLKRIDEIEAARRFEALAAPIVALAWEGLFPDRCAPADVEISGMRSPERFLVAAFRLLRKLRGALIDAGEFRRRALAGARSFYGRPPNFVDPNLLLATPERDHGSLRVDPVELARQHDREIDLAQILARLFELYEAEVVAAGYMTGADAILRAAGAGDAQAGAAVRTAFPYVLVDDAQEITTGERRLLAAIYGAGFAGVTLAGDPAQTTRTLWGATGNGAFAGATVIELATAHRGNRALATRAARILDRTNRAERSDRIVAERSAGRADEARRIARTIAELIAAGTPPAEIALIVRHASTAHAYVEALLDQNLDVQPALGRAVDAFAPIQDLLGVLWCVADPYANEWLLRVLAAPWLRLADATVALLCTERSDGQASLFTDEPEPATGARRRDRARELRLAESVFRGAHDAELAPVIRARLVDFRTAHARWSELDRRVPIATLAPLVAAETVLGSADDSARGRFARAGAEHLIAELVEIERRLDGAPLIEALEYLTFVLASEHDVAALELATPWNQPGVQVLTVENARGAEFRHVFVADVRAGAFPRYYVPDAFLFSRRLGIIPRENVGDARAARTAKFTYALRELRARDQYNAAERRALYVALTRASETAYVSASGRPTRGANTPELLEELRE